MKRIVLALLLAVVSAGPAFPQMMDSSMKEHRDGSRQMHSMDKMDDMCGFCEEHAGKMGLTDDQLEKMRPARREMQKKHVRFKADLKIVEIDLEEIMDVKDFDLEKAKAALRKIAQLKADHQMDVLVAMKDMCSGLSDEQFKKMKKNMSMKMGEKKPGKKMIKKH